MIKVGYANSGNVYATWGEYDREKPWAACAIQPTTGELRRGVPALPCGRLASARASWNRPFGVVCSYRLKRNKSVTERIQSLRARIMSNSDQPVYGRRSPLSSLERSDARIDLLRSDESIRRSLWVYYLSRIFQQTRIKKFKHALRVFLCFWNYQRYFSLIKI